VWPFPDNSFDFITSNQVLEHVREHDFFFSEIHRCLRSGGVSINVFPTREVLWEGHALMPFVHKVRNERRRARLMLLFAKLGFKAHYYREMNRRCWRSLEEFAKVFAHVLETDTNYLTARELVRTAEGAALKASFTYTKDYFLSKLFSYFGYRSYLYKNLGLIDKLAYLGGRYIASVTFLLQKGD
jgi:SAM-dependent methyltransferase